VLFSLLGADLESVEKEGLADVSTGGFDQMSAGGFWCGLAVASVAERRCGGWVQHRARKHNTWGLLGVKGWARGTAAGG
jgi:hypothetical protein